MGIEPKNSRRFLRPAAVLFLIAACLAATREFLSPSAFEILLSRVNSLGPWGPLIFILIYILACVLAMPASVLTLAAGFLFGVWKGYLVVAAGSLLGASAAFWIGRTIGRDWIKRKVEGNARFSAVDRAVSGGGFKIVVLTRLSPVFPFNLQNFAYGVTGVAFRDYFWASLLGMFPGTVMFVYLGSAMKSLAEVVSGKIEAGPAQQTLFVAGLIATLAVTVVATRLAARALKMEVG